MDGIYVYILTCTLNQARQTHCDGFPGAFSIKFLESSTNEVFVDWLNRCIGMSYGHLGRGLVWCKALPAHFSIHTQKKYKRRQSLKTIPNLTVNVTRTSNSELRSSKPFQKFADQQKGY